MKKLVGAVIALVIFAACNNVADKAKNTVNKGGKAVGETATEFIDGISEGVNKTIESKIELSENLKNKGISIGKYYLENDAASGNKNKLVAYIITENDFKGELTFKVFDKEDIEFGRQKIEIVSKAGEARYYDIIFDPRTNIDGKSVIKIN
ncbi:hypothetical protein [Flavobacterium litorale]|uniref:Lipoprotein n=1 Tax=Flavobacterium litorale TaxID=2856519 RepID=A0ABX8V5S5_9FLAO|nr:hypothetical protein [Flavobacterium litorale]QYJ67847.1 hypothetical protein K1I41_09890 [Flavobacterium litorale]